MPKLQVKIGTHRFTVNVDEEGKKEMLEAARRVDQEMTRIKDAHKVADGERSAIMAALHIALAAPVAAGTAAPAADLARLEAALDEALAAAES